MRIGTSRTRVFVLLALLAMQAACATAGATTRTPSPGSLQFVIDSITTQQPVQRTQWGILAIDASTGRVLYEQNARKLFIPASNTKLVVSLTALGRYGPDYQYRTRFLLNGRSADSAASLVLQGTGDPTWGPRFHGDTVYVPLDSMAALVAASGVRRIGALVVDASRFTDELVNDTWEVGDLPGTAAPPIDAVAAAEGTFRMVVAGGARPGDPASVSVVWPLVQPIRANIVTDTPRARTSLSIDFTMRRDTIHVSGSIAPGRVDTLSRAVTQPARTVGEALAKLLAARGVSVGSVRVERDSAAAMHLRCCAQQIAEWVSPPMREIVRIILRPSQNWVAEQVVKSLGAEFGEQGSWRGGIAVEREYLQNAVGLDSLAVNLRDASGMSAQNLISPEAAVAILMHARAQPWSDAFRDALAAPGLEQTTLTNRLRPLTGRLYGKTGTISNVNSLSGYLVALDGRDIVFSIMTNGSGLPSGIVRNAIDAVVLAIAREVDGVDPAAVTTNGGTR